MELHLGWDHIMQGATLLVFGFYMWTQKRMIEKLDKIGTEVTSLRAEHDLLRSSGACPLAQNAFKETKEE